ncbi:hypothetical protein Talka_01076 [Tepidimonas alkaliphilus]|uniref:Uncharacterized protein n=1 Tax=Tepidimonas alkaliphilus TaxID=2588942 RepID=A0A554W9C8_9BURK|nr:hypothetical protein Talka_01076 [Tepidimonas alkaliphilus]
MAENFPYSAQKKVRSAGHWDVVAQHAAVTALERLGQAGGKAEPIRVVLPEPASTFDRTFRDLLITHLVTSGATVVERADAPLQLSVQARLVRHDSDRPHFIPGFFTALTAGVYVAHYLGVHAHQDAAMLGGLGYAALADVARSQYSGGPTHTELVLTTTIMQGERYLARHTNVYYIEDRDVGLFAPPPRLLPTREFKVVSP